MFRSAYGIPGLQPGYPDVFTWQLNASLQYITDCASYDITYSKLTSAIKEARYDWQQCATLGC